VILICGCFSQVDELYDQTLTKIAFGSCNRQSISQDWQRQVMEIDPQLWLWLGDAVYSDYRMFFPFLFRARPTDQYKELIDNYKNSAEYSLFRETIPNIIGVWDDHDYGINDGDGSFAYKYQNQKHFLDFLDVKENSPRRTRNGLYSSYTFGKDDKSITFILLDVRFFRTDEDILGSEQWQWLEKQLKNTKSRINIIGSGIQMLPGDKFVQEKWIYYPGNLDRLIFLIAKYKVPGTILMSGDVHMGEMMVANCSDIGYPLYEITSSGLTHSVRSQVPFISPSTIGKYYRSSLTTYLTYDKNFGSIDIDWNEPVSITLNLHNVSNNGLITFKQKIFINDLKYKKDIFQKENCIVKTDIALYSALFFVRVIYTSLIIIIFMILYCCCCCKKKK